MLKKSEPCLAAVKRVCPFSDREFMIAKAQAQMAKELVAKLAAGDDDLALAIASESAARSKERLDQFADETTYLPCSEDAGVCVACDDCVDLPGRKTDDRVMKEEPEANCSAMWSVTFFFGPISNTLLKKINFRDNSQNLESIVHRFHQHARRRIQIRKRSDDLAWLLEQKTGKFVVRSGNDCFAWDADEQLLLDPRDLTLMPIAECITCIGTINKVYEIILVEKKRKQSDVSSPVSKKQKLTYETASPEVRDIRNSALKATAAVVAISPVLYNELSAQFLPLEQVMHRLSTSGYTVNRIRKPSLDWLLAQTNGSFVVRRPTRHCVAWYASMQLVLDTNPLNPLALPINTETLDLLGISGNQIYKVYSISNKRRAVVTPGDDGYELRRLEKVDYTKKNYSESDEELLPCTPIVVRADRLKELRPPVPLGLTPETTRGSTTDIKTLETVRWDGEKRAGEADSGCQLFALNKVVEGVLCAEDLDSVIPEVWKELQQANPHYKREWAGIEGQTWHLNCIKQALLARYGRGNFTWKRVKTEKQKELEFLTKRNQGKFYVHGTLNPLNFPDLDPEGDWTHAICVDTDKNVIWCKNNLGEPMEGANWLKKHSYLTTISRIYKLKIKCKKSKPNLDSVKSSARKLSF